MNGQVVFKNLIWRFLERIGAQGVTLLVSIILARILEPSVYGIIALVTVFTSILQVFVDSGLGNALIQKKDADNIDFSSVFFFNMAVCLVLYCLMFLAAPLIAHFYNMPDLIPVIRVLSLTLLISGFKNVQQAYVSKNMQFKKFFFSTLAGTIGAGVIGIIIALNGGGVWSIVIQNLFNLFVDTVVLWFTVKWRPQLVFSWERLKGLLSFGWKLLLTSFINNVYNNIRQLIIGKKYSSDSLAFYNRGKQFPFLIATNVNTSIDNVLFSAMSSAQDDTERVRNMTRRSIKISSYIMAPLMIGLAVVAESLISLILTDKWIPCVPFLRIFCLAFIIEPITTANYNAMKAMGRSDLYLKLNIIDRIIGMLLIVIAMNFGVMAIAYSMLIGTIIGQFIIVRSNVKLLQYCYFDQIKDILPGLILSLVMGVLISLISLFSLPVLLTLVMQVIAGFLIYISLSKLFKVDSYLYIISMVKMVFKKKEA